MKTRLQGELFGNENNVIIEDGVVKRVKANKINKQETAKA
jgi:hypothetical protein